MSNFDIIKEFVESDYYLSQALNNGYFDSPALLVGNGITRLALSNSPSWFQWIKELWGEIDPQIPFEYMLMRDVSLPECINYLNKQAEDDKKKLELIFYKLWKYTELSKIPNEIDKSPKKDNEIDLRFHALCVKNFKYIFTTNYDTLFERTCKKLGYNVVLYEFTPMSFNRNPNFLYYGSKNANSIFLIKLHGTFPFDHIAQNRDPIDTIFRNWYNNKGPDKLVAGITQYALAYQYNRQKVDDLENALELSNKIASLFFLGYGMKSEDDIVVQISKKYATYAQIAMTYGGDIINTLRYETNWGIPHLSLPAEHGGGKSARMDAHINFVEYFLNGGTLQPSKPPQIHPQGIMVGQSNYVNVIRTAEAPTQERSYKISKGKFTPSSSLTDKVYEVEYVAGQILTPAILLDRWNVKTNLVSFIGYDSYGLKIHDYLIGKPNIDWSNLIQDKKIITDHSIVVTHDGVRTLYDSGDHSNYGLIKETFKNISKAIKNKRIIPSFIYLSKWYLEEVSHDRFLNEWVSASNYPLVCYETGTKGSEIDHHEEFYLEREIGKYCDVMLASSLFVMRAFRMPIYKNKRTINNYNDTTLKEYDELYTEGSPEGYSNRAHQNTSFVNGLYELTKQGSKIEDFIDILFNSSTAQTKFSNVTWWVVTLGDLGMVAFSKHKDPNNNQAWWIKAPTVEKNRIVNALGCGDASRAGFLGYYVNNVFTNKTTANFNKTDDFLNNCSEVINAVKCAVYIGAEKIKYFDLEDAVKDLSWNNVITQSKTVEVFNLNKEQNMKKLHLAIKHCR